MTNVSGLRIEDYQDIESVNFAEDRKKKKAGRKKKFVPILHGTAGTMRGRQCSGMRKNTPDLQREHRGWRKIRITRRSMWKTAEKNPDSLFYFYQKLIALRRKNDTLVYGDFRLIEEENPDIFAYERNLGEKKLIVLCNFRDTAAEMKARYDLTKGTVLVHNDTESLTKRSVEVTAV